MEDDKEKKNKDLKNVYKRETSRRDKVDDPEALDKIKSKRDLANAFKIKEKRKFLQVLRDNGFTEETDAFRELVEMWTRMQGRW